MRIGIDVRVLEKGITGIGRFLVELLDSLPNQDTRNEYFLFSSSKISYSNNKLKKIVTGSSRIPPKIYAPVWLNFVLPKLLKKYKIDIFFTPNYLLPIKKIKNVKTIIVVSDVVHLISKNFHSFSYNLYLKLFLPLSIKNSSEIITISENSKNDIIKFYNVRVEKIKVVYIVANKIFINCEVDVDKVRLVKNKFNLASKFLLYVGVLENRKNILGLLKITELLRNNGQDIHLVLIGKPGFGFQKIKKEIDSRSKYVQYLNYVDDDSLAIIYRLAHVFVFPSYYEGFGIPPLEAMKVGLPVVSSNSSSLKEVVGNGGILCDPNNHDAFVQSITKLLEDKVYYNKMKEKALNQAKTFDRNVEIKKIIETFNKYIDEK